MGNWRAWIGRKLLRQPHMKHRTWWQYLAFKAKIQARVNREALLMARDAGRKEEREKMRVQFPPIFGEKPPIHVLPGAACLSCPVRLEALPVVWEEHPPIASPYPQNPGLAQALDITREPPTLNELQASNDAFVLRNQAYGATLPTSHETPIIRLAHIKDEERKRQPHSVWTWEHKEGA